MRTKSTKRTKGQREALQEERRERRQIAALLKTAMDAMSTAQQVALVAIAKEMAWPGSIEEMVYNCPSAKPRQLLGLT